MPYYIILIEIVHAKLNLKFLASKDLTFVRFHCSIHIKFGKLKCEILEGTNRGTIGQDTVNRWKFEKTNFDLLAMLLWFFF